MTEEKGIGDKRKQILGGGGKHEEYFLKRILIRKAIIGLGGRERAWEIHAIRPIGDQKQFLSNSLWEGNLARAKKHVQENKCEGERPETPCSPVPGLLLQASRSSHAPGRRGRQTADSHPGATLGTSIRAATGQTEEFFYLWRIF